MHPEEILRQQHLMNLIYADDYSSDGYYSDDYSDDYYDDEYYYEDLNDINFKINDDVEFTLSTSDNYEGRDIDVGVELPGTYTAGTPSKSKQR